MTKKKPRKRTGSGKPVNTFEPKEKPALDLAIRLMGIRGGPGNEGEVAEFITRKLRQAGAPPSMIQSDQANLRTPIKGQVRNLIVKLPGTIRGPRRLLMAHMDTVLLCVGAKPVLKKNFVRAADPKTALGADDRAGCAVLLNTAIALLKNRLPHPPLTFLWTIQEEPGLHGVRNLRLGMLGKPKLAFNFDGGGPEKLTIGATGGYRMLIEIEGIASHAGGAPDEGVSAIAIAALAIADLHQKGWHGKIRKGHRSGTSNVGVIEGGEATNVVTDFVRIKAEARSHDAVFRRQIVSKIEKTFKRAARSVRNIDGACGKVRFSGRLDYESFKLSAEEPCVLEAKSAVKELGGKPLLAISDGGLDANWMVAHGIPTVSLGCGQRNIHTVKEQLDVAAFQRACRIAARLALGQLGKQSTFITSID